MSNLINTVREKEEFLSYIEILSESFFKKEGFKKTLATIPQKYSSIILSAVRKEKDAQQALNYLKKELENTEEVNISLSFSPSISFIEKIIGFIKRDSGKNIILNIQEDENIIAGAVLSFKGFYADYSLKKELENGFERNKKEIKKLLNL